MISFTPNLLYSLEMWTKSHQISAAAQVNIKNKINSSYRNTF